MTTTPSVSLAEHFDDLPDPRVDRTRLHELLDIVVLAICAVISGAETREAVAAYGDAKKDWLKTFLRLPNGIPAHDTFRRVFTTLNPDAFQQGFLSWMDALWERVGLKRIAVDGKTLRHAYDRTTVQGALHLVSARATANHLTLGQVAVDGKSNEITAIPELLKILDLAGAIVTIDAMSCQKDIAQQIRAGGGHYVLALKNNQPNLLADVQQCFAEQLDNDFADVKQDSHETVATAHGRKETRSYTVIYHPPGLRDAALWQDLKTICLVVSERTVNGETSCEARYYIGSFEGTAEDYRRVIRGHWGIENSLPWVLDVTFREDRSRLRLGHGAQNLALLRRIAVSLLKNEKSCKDSIQTKRLRAACDNDYLVDVLGVFSKN